MDNGLVRAKITFTRNFQPVLILVVMDNGLVQICSLVQLLVSLGLNPCCNGQWSRTRPYKTILIISKLKNFTKQILTFLNRKLTIS